MDFKRVAVHLAAFVVGIIVLLLGLVPGTVDVRLALLWPMVVFLAAFASGFVAAERGRIYGLVMAAFPVAIASVILVLVVVGEIPFHGLKMSLLVVPFLVVAVLMFFFGVAGGVSGERLRQLLRKRPAQVR